MTIKETLFNPPLVNPSILEIRLKAKNLPSTELGAGEHDLTPDGFRDRYIVIVSDSGNGDNKGVVVVSRRGGKAISSMEYGITVMEYCDKKKIDLDTEGSMVALGRPNSLDNPGDHGYKVYGVVFYEPANK